MFEVLSPEAHLCGENVGDNGQYDDDIDDQGHELRDATGGRHFQNNEDDGTDFLDFLHSRYREQRSEKKGLQLQ